MDFYFETLDDGSYASGTSLKGQFYTTYDRLVEVFGPPTQGPDANEDKVTCCWVLQFDDGEIGTIYDWKTYQTPMLPYSWHIGGHTAGVVDRIISAIKE